MRRGAALLVVTALLASAAPAAHADDTPDVTRARAEYAAATEFVKEAKWAEALAAFERSARLRPHATTTFDIAACERALGRYTQALVTLRRALSENAARPGELADSFVGDATAMTGEIERLLAHVEVTVAPASAAIAVDGRPLQAGPPGSKAFVAGLAPPGVGAPAPADTFEVVLDPGAHVFTLTGAGYEAALVTRVLAPGAREALAIRLDRLPATLHVEASAPDAVVTVEGYDVGTTPVDVTRPAGSYRVRVRKHEFDAYETMVVLRPGENASIRASLAQERHPLTERWWFWAGVGAIVAGAAVTTYAVTRPGPTTPPYSGGSLGWVATASAIRW